MNEIRPDIKTHYNSKRKGLPDTVKRGRKSYKHPKISMRDLNVKPRYIQTSSQKDLKQKRQLHTYISIFEKHQSNYIDEGYAGDNGTYSLLYLVETFAAMKHKLNIGILLHTAVVVISMMQGLMWR